MARRAAGLVRRARARASARSRRVGGVVYALFQHDLKRLLALHSIENVGIIVLGLGACLLLRARGADAWAAFALAAALLHTLNHAVFKALLFLGAGAFERAVGSLELDRLGGLLRRMPWTGGAFLVGAMAIAGLPPLNGFASEWLTLQALLHVPAYGHVGDGIGGRGRARRARGDGRAGASSASSRSSASCCSGRRGARRSPTAVEAPLADARRRRRSSPRRASCSALAPGLLFGALVGLAPWPARRPTRVGLRPARARARCRRSGSRSCSSALTARARAAARPPERRAGADLGVRAARRAARCTGRAPASPSRCGSCSRRFCGPEREITVAREGGVVQEVAYSGHVPHLIDERVYRPARADLARRGAAHARRLQSGSLGTYVAYLIGARPRPARRRPDRG